MCERFQICVSALYVKCPVPVHRAGPCRTQGKENLIPLSAAIIKACEHLPAAFSANTYVFVCVCLSLL